MPVGSLRASGKDGQTKEPLLRVAARAFISEMSLLLSGVQLLAHVIGREGLSDRAQD